MNVLDIFITLGTIESVLFIVIAIADHIFPDWDYIRSLFTIWLMGLFVTYFVMGYWAITLVYGDIL
jgi:antibiotic biosynthesis monooxygenase (ABM) superfamily enzyme